MQTLRLNCCLPVAATPCELARDGGSCASTPNNSLQATTPAAFTSARFARLRFGLRVLRLSSRPLGGLPFAFVTSATLLWLVPSLARRNAVREFSASGPSG
jgi:hypothetical protein